MLTRPESESSRSTLRRLVPARSVTVVSATAQVSQEAVGASVSFGPVAPSTCTVSVREALCPSEPTALAYRTASRYDPAAGTAETSVPKPLPLSSNPFTKPDPVAPVWSAATPACR